ncbi:hypothetical protein EMPS_04557 [Entomortierella parvispora]|uniref:MTOR-associated protein MEAK7 n=1 Tax=Entomortierella parvispora TaxID=205924 RepID=A0A9P3H8X1_9FUNG|nr:hypothetical protein EMPS_04557 [Entomortierella parvispora]
MGSQTSKQDPAIDACLLDFPENERTHVLALFDKLVAASKTTDDDERHHKGADEDSIDPQHFTAYFNPLLPPTLLTCFRVTMQLHSSIHVHKPSEDISAMDPNTLGGSAALQSGTASGGGSAAKSQRRSAMRRSTSVDSGSRISKYGWVMTIHRLSKTSIEEQAGLSFMLQTHDRSLESFVANVTRAVMAFWLAGEVKSWRDIPEKDMETTAEFLLTRQLQQQQEQQQGLTELDDDFGTASSSPKSTRAMAAQEWLESAQKRDKNGNPSTKELSRSAFLNWYQKTVEYQILFTILIQNLFLGPSTLVETKKGDTEGTGAGKRIKMEPELENRLLQKNYIAPRIKGGLDVAPHYSRLLSVVDFFQLRYALPSPAYSMNPSFGSTKKQGNSSGTSAGGGMDPAMGSESSRACPPLRLLFSSKTSGASFSTLLQKIMYQGPTLVVMKDEDGYIFGAYADQDWEQGPKFFGTDRSFLFSIRPKLRIYRPSRVNNNFQYLDSGTKTLPNGMGFGGQLRYFGLWLASDFQSGQSAAEPLCSTYQSPRLSKQQNFKLDEMEVWQVHPSVMERPDSPKNSAMDAHPDAVALLEMANRKMYSKDVRAPENHYDSD